MQRACLSIGWPNLFVFGLVVVVVVVAAVVVVVVEDDWKRGL